jgi:hydrogenase expression/formation protein HypC
LSRVDEEEAHRTYQALVELDQLGELDTPEIEEEATPPLWSPPGGGKA